MTKNIKYLILILIGIFITLVVILSGAYLDRREASRVIDDMTWCYESADQCGIHNILEENEIEDPSIEMNITWLEDNTFNLSESDVEKGLTILRYLYHLSYSDRQDFMIKFQDEYWRIHGTN